MITYEKLGINGRLGNQMFQYAVLLGIKAKKGFSIVLNEELSNTLELVKNFNISECHFYNKRDISYKFTYKEEFFHYDRRLINKVTDGYNLEGYFQTHKYFEHCDDLVRDQFTFSNEIVERANNFLNPIKKDFQIVTLHVRRTDYVNLPNHHPLCSIEYYKNAINEFNENETLFLVCSDDIQWCRENIQAKNIAFSNNDTFTDMCLMTMADHNIIANSSYSWWGSWLNPNKDKKVIAPSTWFGLNYFHWVTDDLYYDRVKKLRI